MKKLKKLLKNKKPVVIFIYGPQAVGKLTVATILSKKLGYKLDHNHHINDFVAGIFERSSLQSHSMKQHLRFYVLSEIVKAKINVVTTFCYAHDYVSKTGLSDPRHVQKLEKKVTKLGARFFGVHLKANTRVLLRRVDMQSRREFKKLTDKKIMRELALKHDWQSSPKLKNNLIIDNTNLSPNKVSDMIIKNFKLK